MKAFIPNKNFGKELAREPEAREGLAEIAKVAVGFVTQFAEDAEQPWMGRRGHELIEVQADADGVFIVNTDYGAHLAEWGSKNNPPHAPLRRGVRAAGFRLDEDSKT